jgi:hypothetical protein
MAVSNDYSASGHYGYGVFIPGGARPWVATLTEDHARMIAEVLGAEGWLGPVFEVRALNG